ncbi:MAG TPA: hypothetical protein VFY90_03275 [Tepidiformaceae bacterium]|nr:hypothetical protein [Tepidiformaceae bacterium]
MDKLYTRISRRSLMRGSLVVGVGAAAVALVGCGDDDDGAQAISNPTATPAPNTPTATAANQQKLVSGWFKGREVKYYDFGTRTTLAGSGPRVATAPIFVLIKGMKADGTPDMVQDQHNIVTVMPGDAGYSDLWQVNLVTVPAGYVANTIKSKADIDSRGLQIQPADMFVNCPIVPKGTTFENGEPLVQGWKDGQEVFYPDFGANVPAAIPILVFSTGMGSDGMPQLVKDQHNIIDAIPGDAAYSAFWQVNLVTVPAGYTANTIKSADDVRAMGLPVTPTGMVVNCPVVMA